MKIIVRELWGQLPPPPALPSHNAPCLGGACTCIISGIFSRHFRCVQILTVLKYTAMCFNCVTSTWHFTCDPHHPTALVSRRFLCTCLFGNQLRFSLGAKLPLEQTSPLPLQPFPECGVERPRAFLQLRHRASGGRFVGNCVHVRDSWPRFWREGPVSEAGGGLRVGALRLCGSRLSRVAAGTWLGPSRG